ncbi:MAG: RNA polymerase sigma factor [Bacillota bacterium]
MNALDNNFDEIFKSNYDKVFSFIYSVSASWTLAEDITQETFIKAFKNIHSFRNESKISTWLNKIAYNIFIDYKRENKSPLLSIDDDMLLAKLADLKKNLPKETEQRIMSQCIQEKIMKIPEKNRIPLLLDIQGYTNQEKAMILGYSLDNTKIRLHRARKKLREILGEDCLLYYDERNVFC